MRLSLKTLFGVLTISCLVALVFQEEKRADDLIERNIELKAEIAGFAPNLETSLEYLRIAAKPDQELISFHAKALEILDAEYQAFLNSQTKDANSVGIIHLPEMELSWKQFAIFVPEGQSVSFQVFASDNPFEGRIKDALTQSVFALSKTVNIQLEPGIALLKILPDAEEDEKADGIWNLELNGKVVATVDASESGFNAQNLIWLMSNQKFLTLRHQNIHKLAAHFLEPDKPYLEFAAIYSTEFYKKLDSDPGSGPTYLKFALSIDDKVNQ